MSIAVAPLDASLPAGLTRQFTATGLYSDGTKQDITSTVGWTSTEPSIASISNAAGAIGLATTVSAGTTTITASAGSVSGTTKLTVTTATLVSISVTPAAPSIAKGTLQKFTATGLYNDNSTQNITASVTWSSSSTARGLHQQ
jgi:trimeric autotransporter adhesin